MSGIFSAQVFDYNTEERYESDWINAIKRYFSSNHKKEKSPNRYTLDDLKDLHHLSNTNKKKLEKLSPGKYVDCGKHSSSSRYIIYHITQEELDHESEINVVMDEIRSVNKEIEKAVPELLAQRKELEQKLRKLQKGVKK